MTTKGGPWADKEVRRALMIGTDLQAILDTFHDGQGEIQVFPFNPGLPTTIHTPIEDLPPSAKELFTYDPEKAMQMLADAGYPDGFEMELVYAPAYPKAEDEAAFFKALWTKIGVDLTLIPVDFSIQESKRRSGDYTGGLLVNWGTVDILPILDSNRFDPSMHLANDPWYNEQVDKTMAESDEVKRNAMIKELGIFVIDEVVAIPTGLPVNLAAWWPWVKNYYGEIECGFGNLRPLVSTLWLDQDLKAELGY